MINKEKFKKRILQIQKSKKSLDGTQYTNRQRVIELPIVEDDEEYYD